VAVREDFSTGAVQTGLLSAGAGGEVAELALGRSGLGDGLIAWRQGPFGNAAIVAAQVTAPPAELILNVSKGWVKPAQAVVSWQPAVSADGPLRYTVVLDGRRQPTPAGASQLLLDTRGLSSGSHSVQLLATDIDGQSTLSKPSTLLLADGPPSVDVARAQGGYAVSVRVSDTYAGVAKKYVTVSFGDGRNAHGRASYEHRYAHGGVYHVVVYARDKLGNADVVSRWVQVR
jgi:PKD domain